MNTNYVNRSPSQEALSLPSATIQQRHKKLLIRPYWLLCILAGAIPFQYEIEIPQLNGARLTLLTVGTGILFVLFGLSFLPPRSKLGRLLKTPHLVLFMLYLVLSTIAIARGPTVTGFVQGIWSIFRAIIVSSILYVGGWLYLYNEATLRKILSWLSFGAALCGLIAIIQTLTDGKVLSGLGTNYRYLGFLTRLPNELITGSLDSQGYLTGTNIFRGHGTFLTANGLGVFLSTTIFIAWGLMLIDSSRKRWFWILVLVVQLGGLLATFSRSAWAAFGAGFIFAILLKFYTDRKIQITQSQLLRGIGLSTGFIVVLLIFPTDKIVSRSLSIMSPTQVDEFNWRIIVWEYSLEKIQDHPTFGLGTSIIYNSDAKVPGSGNLAQFTSHNLWLNIGYQRGLIVLTIFTLFTFFAFYGAWNGLMRRKLRHQNEYILLTGLTSSLVTFLISGLGSSSMQYENLASLFWLLVIGIVFLSRCLKTRDFKENLIQPYFS